MEQKQDQEQEDQIQVISDNVKTETTTVHIDGLRFALGNDIIMENIVNSMDLEDLDHWFKFCKKFQWPKKTYRDMHTLLKNYVDTRVDKIRDILQFGVFRKHTDVAQAASLAYHGLLGLPGPHWRLIFSFKICGNWQNIEQDLSNVPRAHLAALKAYSASDTRIGI